MPDGTEPDAPLRVKKGGIKLGAKLLLTGRPGCGKTTVIEKTVGRLGRIAGGFSTREIRVKGRRVGFLVTDLHTGKEGVLAHVNRKGPPRVSKYGVDLSEFERIGVEALHDALRRDGCIVIDEIGKMELFSQAFQHAVTGVIDSDHPVLGTIASFRHPFLSTLRRRDDVEIIEVTTSNRDGLPDQLLAMSGFSG